MRAGCFISLDGLRLTPGGTLPLDSRNISTPEFVKNLCHRHAVASLPDIDNLERIDIQSNPQISSNCNILLVTAGWSESAEDFPKSFFIKTPSPNLATRWFLNVIESWKLETRFCQKVADTLPIKTPKTYAAVARGSRFCLLQEDLNANPEIELFTNFDMNRGPPLDRIRQCLDTFAQLHSAHYHWSSEERLSLLPLDQHPFLGKHMRHIAPTLNRYSLSPCRRLAPGIIAAEMAQVYRLTMAHWDSLVAYWYAEPRSLCHGDSHLGNFYRVGDEMGMLDFQAVHWGNGIRDVQYFLTDSVPAEILAQHEEELIMYYTERRRVHGSEVDYNDTWHQYRGFSFHTWMTMVTSIGLGAMSAEQDSLMREILRRCVAAIERLHYKDWLEDFIARC